jgi:iron(III) transport system permease protein
MIALVLLVLLVYLVVVPFITIIQSSFMWLDTDRRISGGLAQPGTYTFFHWYRVLFGELSGAILWGPFWNSIVIAVGATTLAMTIGGVLAWLTVRTDMPGRRLLSSLIPIPYVIPSWPLALAWITTFKTPDVGGRPGLLQAVFGIHVPIWLSYGPIPIVICEALHYYAFTYLLLVGALATLDSRLEESAEVLGASRWRILARVTFPLMLPAILSGLALTFSRTLSAFGTPYFLGVPIRYYTLPMMLYTNMNPSTGSPGDGYVLALVLISLSVLTIVFNQRAIGKRKSFVTLTGKGFTSRQTTLGKLRWPVTIAVWFYIIIFVFGPLLIIAWQSLMLRDGDYSLANLTLHYWNGEPTKSIGEGESGILLSPAVQGAAWNSVKLAIVTAIICAFLGLLLGYSIVKGRGTRLSRIVEQVSFLPFVIPSIAFGMQIGGELEEAAVMAGASWWTRFRRIILPMSVSGLLSGFLLTFITTMRELALIILLVTPDTRVLTTLTFRYQEQGYPQFSSAIVMVIIAIVLSANFLVARLRISKRSGAGGHQSMFG